MELDKSGVEHEQNFWKGFVKTERFKNNWLSDSQNPELRQCVVDFINKLTDERSLDVLDVGSGPISILHGLDGIYITTVDPLGKFYEEILDYSKLNVRPPFTYPAERLHNGFKEAFDVVHISNALDHTKHPGQAFETLWECVTPGGYLIVQGFENEAVHEQFKGFHQYNIKLSGKALVIEDKSGKKEELHVDTQNTVMAETIYLPETGRNWIVWITQRPSN